MAALPAAIVSTVPLTAGGAQARAAPVARSRAANPLRGAAALVLNDPPATSSVSLAISAVTGPLTASVAVVTVPLMASIVARYALPSAAADPVTNSFPV